MIPRGNHFAVALYVAIGRAENWCEVGTASGANCQFKALCAYFRHSRCPDTSASGILALAHVLHNDAVCEN